MKSWVEKLKHVTFRFGGSFFVCAFAFFFSGVFFRQNGSNKKYTNKEKERGKKQCGILCDKRIHIKIYRRFNRILEAWECCWERRTTFPKQMKKTRRTNKHSKRTNEWMKEMKASGEREDRTKKGKGNIYSQVELCTQCMHSNMYLMHNKKETSKKKRK